MNRATHLIAVWCGPALTVLVGIGLLLLAGFLPPPAPSDSAEQIAERYRENLGAIRAGMVVSLVAMAMIVPWGVAVATHLRPAEGELPVLTRIQLASVSVGTILALMVIVVWSTAAFRPDQVAAETTRMLNDLGWILFVFTWPPFSIWCGAIALAVLSDRSPSPVHPRWLGYFNLWVAFLFTPGSLIIFFKTGPFAFNGLIGLWVPFTAFFAWLILMTVFTIKAINRRAASAT